MLVRVRILSRFGEGVDSAGSGQREAKSFRHVHASRVQSGRQSRGEGVGDCGRGPQRHDER